MLAGGATGLAVALAAHLVNVVEADFGDELRDENVDGATHARACESRQARVVSNNM